MDRPPHTAAPRFDSPARIAYVNALFIIGTLGTLITPALLESWARLHWTQTQLGLVAACELAALAAGSLSGLYWQRRWNWRPVTVTALLLGVVANIACVLTDDFLAVCIARCAAGVAGGLLCGIYSAFLANSASPGRIIAITTFIQIGFEALLLFTANSLLRGTGSIGLFILMGLLLVALIPQARLLPTRWPSETPSPEFATTPRTHSPRAYPLLLSFVPFIMVQTGVYTFLAEFARLAAHLEIGQALRIIGVSVALSSLGSVAAFMLNERSGLLLPIGSAILLLVGMMCGMVLGSRSPALFLVFISLLQIGWIFLNCYLYAALIDANNLLVPAATPLSCFGSAFGASAMGYVLERNGLNGALGMTLGCLGLTAMLTIPFLIPRPVKAPGTAGQLIAR